MLSYGEDQKGGDIISTHRVLNTEEVPPDTGLEGHSHHQLFITQEKNRQARRIKDVPGVT